MTTGTYLDCGCYIPATGRRVFCPSCLDGAGADPTLERMAPPEHTVPLAAADAAARRGRPVTDVEPDEVLDHRHRSRERVATLRRALVGRPAPSLGAVLSVLEDLLESVVDSSWSDADCAAASIGLSELNTAHALIAAIEQLERRTRSRDPRPHRGAGR